MFAPEELAILNMVNWQPEDHVVWKPHMTIEIPAAPASFEEMPLESPVLKKHAADYLGDELHELAASNNELAANHELAASPIEMIPEDPQEELIIQEEDHQYITINLANGCQQMIEITGMTDEEIDAAVEAAYDEFALELELDCPDELRYLYAAQ